MHCAFVVVFGRSNKLCRHESCSSWRPAGRCEHSSSACRGSTAIDEVNNLPAEFKDGVSSYKIVAH